MIIQRSSTGIGGLLPEAFEVLLSELPAQQYSAMYGLRHPLGVYRVSLTKVFDSFVAVLHELHSVISTKPFLQKHSAEWEPRLLGRQRELLYSLMEHMDDCKSVLKCFLPPGHRFGRVPQVRSFRDSIKNYRDHIGKVANHVKHRQGRLRAIVFYDDDHSYPGYFVEGVDQHGVVGPALEIHKGGATAFSFSRDLRFHLCSVYIVSRHLAESVRDLPGPREAARSAEDDRCSQVAEIARRISLLPLVFFPDECSLPVPTVRAASNVDGGITLILSYPDNQAAVRTFSRMRVAVRYQGDGVTRSFRIPYLSTHEHAQS